MKKQTEKVQTYSSSPVVEVFESQISNALISSAQENGYFLQLQNCASQDRSQRLAYSSQFERLWQNFRRSDSSKQAERYSSAAQLAVHLFEIAAIARWVGGGAIESCSDYEFYAYSESRFLLASKPWHTTSLSVAHAHLESPYPDTAFAEQMPFVQTHLELAARDIHSSDWFLKREAAFDIDIVIEKVTALGGLAIKCLELSIPEDQIIDSRVLNQTAA